MNTFLISTFGASWKTTVLGWLAGVIVIVQGMIANGTAFPTNTAGWLQFIGGVLIGLLGQEAKSKGVSNAPTPLAVSQPVMTSPSTGAVIAPVAGSTDLAVKP